MRVFVVLLSLVLSASAALGEIYTWKDAKGTVFYTNSLHEIPARYLKRARVLDVATGKTGGPALAQPGTPVSPAPAGQAPSMQSSPVASPVPPAAALLPAPGAPPAPTPVAAPATPPPASPDAATTRVPAPEPGVTATRHLRSDTGERRRSSRRRASSGTEE